MCHKVLSDEKSSYNGLNFTYIKKNGVYYYPFVIGQSKDSKLTNYITN